MNKVWFSLAAFLLVCYLAGFPLAVILGSPLWVYAVGAGGPLVTSAAGFVLVARLDRRTSRHAGPTSH